ncbi:lymphocyte antigen 6K [Phascolarctos cinereus]|uniref:Lymphocyte antigen 6D-like n=1 Tax=Phascolarctos cinereus TaxID=38626 RepID=A0A6P5KXC8_PHACI|nr:lymphocyte antigen 6D-like [Phascolarctos cinereus]
MRKMKILLSITMLAILYTDFVPVFNGNVSSALNNTNIIRLRGLDTETTTSLVRLQCHVCMGDFQCQAPQTCAPTEKFCMIAQTDKNEYNVIKYCAETCPYMERFHGRSEGDGYLACCAQDLCNYKRLGSGHRALCASVQAVAMAFIASFFGTLRVRPGDAGIEL